ncbi:conserved Plasmodium protein, unknown function [Plasmodium gallinaceum]|uniref:Uncharacterized protein n=1 Tax=Plasmodium gallinaceum TaxID=5849 RepID=A0A1J1GQB8_PLAGA|nr:conserved Plasmodium protein, unknown function [Plasmodium gallinaceum]CRG94635.1 conserved Plasmodium protein, unknown function [Plasmodium gallinaceum]
MQKFIDKVKLQNTQEDNSNNKRILNKKIYFDNLLNKKNKEVNKIEEDKILNVVKTYYQMKLKKKAFLIILNEYYRIQSILCVTKLNDTYRRWKIVFYIFLKNKYSCKIKKCVRESLGYIIEMHQRTNLKSHFFKILKNKIFNINKIYLKIKKKRVNKIMKNVFYKWFLLSMKSLNSKFEKAWDYYILRKKKRVFYLWKRLIDDENFFKNIDMTFFKLEKIASSWMEK